MFRNLMSMHPNVTSLVALQEKPGHHRTAWQLKRLYSASVQLHIVHIVLCPLSPSHHVHLVCGALSVPSTNCHNRAAAESEALDLHILQISDRVIFSTLYMKRQSNCLTLGPTMSQPGDSSEVIHKRMMKRRSEIKYVCKKKQWHHPYFDN